MRTYLTMGTVRRSVSDRAWEGVAAQPYDARDLAGVWLVNRPIKRLKQSKSGFLLGAVEPVDKLAAGHIVNERLKLLGREAGAESPQSTRRLLT